MLSMFHSHQHPEIGNIISPLNIACEGKHQKNIAGKINNTPTLMILIHKHIHWKHEFMLFNNFYFSVFKFCIHRLWYCSVFRSTWIWMKNFFTRKFQNYLNTKFFYFFSHLSLMTWDRVGFRSKKKKTLWLCKHIFLIKKHSLLLLVVLNSPLSVPPFIIPPTDASVF